MTGGRLQTTGQLARSRFPSGRGPLVSPRSADGCIARVIRERVRATPPSPAALLLPEAMGLLLRAGKPAAGPHPLRPCPGTIASTTAASSCRLGLCHACDHAEERRHDRIRVLRPRRHRRRVGDRRSRATGAGRLPCRIDPPPLRSAAARPNVMKNSPDLIAVPTTDRESDSQRHTPRTKCYGQDAPRCPSRAAKPGR